jgi:hypothetical protein
VADRARTSDRWKELLESVREELGEGRIRGIAWRRRLDFSSVAGKWELRVGGDEDGPTCICLEYTGKKRFPARADFFHTPPRGSLRTGDKRFDAIGSIETTEPRKWEGRISAGVQGSLLRLWDLHPSTFLTVYKDCITVTLPGTLHDRDAILSFLFHASACVGEILHAATA